MKVHQAIAKALIDNGVDTLFGLLGEANLYLSDCYVREFGGAYVAAAHEAGAVLMAQGHAAMSGRVGVSTVTVGPAMTNTITALVEGVKAALPTVLLSGDTPAEDRDNIQRVPVRELVTVIGAGFEQMRSPQTAVQDVVTCLQRAVLERRPIVLNMPSEFQWAEVDYQPLAAHVPPVTPSAGGGVELENAIGIIAAARRPLVIAGRGATSDEARTAILGLAKRIGAPVATTLKGKDLFRDEPFNLGICGTVSTPAAVDTVVESDCIIAFGASLNSFTISHGALRRGKRIIQVNAEATEVARYGVVDAAVVGDPAATADMMVHWMDEAEIPPSGWRTDELEQKLRAAALDSEPFADDGEGTVDFRRAMTHLDQILPADRILVTDGGRFGRYTWRAIRTRGAGNFMSNNSGSIGLGMAQAIGAAMADRNRTVVLVTGDGGFMNGGLTEFNTAVRHDANLIVILCNDSCYGAEYLHFDRRGLDPGIAFFNWPDFAPVAVALGGAGISVRSTGDLDRAGEAIANRTGPLLIELKLDARRMPTA